MKKNKLVLPLFILLAGQFSLAQNPFVRDIYTADPSAHVWSDGRLYVYPSHDISPPRGCDLMDKYHVYSTDDMVNWIDHGQIVEANQVHWGQPLADGGKFMWAPDCAYRDGKYYFYFPHPDKDPWNSNWKIGIAVSDQPASDFTILSEPLKGLPESGEIDPCVFIDDDGQAYFYYGGGNHCFGAKLKENMIELDGTLQPMTGLYDFHEGTWVFKRNGVYYLTYADNNGGANRLRYATSDNPLGPWSHKGIYLNSTTSDTSHGSVVEYMGQWWAFYHTADLSGTGLLRSICVDSLFFDESGAIQTVVQTKDAGEPYQNTAQIVPGTIEAEDYNEGGQGIAYWDNTKGNLQWEYRRDDVDIKRNSRPVFYYVTDMSQGEYLNYTFEVSEPGVYDVNFTIGAVSESVEVRFYLEFDGKKTSNPRRYTVPYAQPRELATVTVSNIQLDEGKHTVTFYPSGNMNFDKFTFVLQGTDIQTPLSETPLVVYPNPTGGIIYFASPVAGKATITDLNGRIIYSGILDDSRQSIDISGTAPGIYLITLQSEQETFQGKIYVK